jgi:hypothetical protein
VKAVDVLLAQARGHLKGGRLQSAQDALDQVDTFAVTLQQSSLAYVVEQELRAAQCVRSRTPFVGDLATMQLGSDFIPMTVIAMSPSGHKVTLQRRIQKRTDGNGMSDLQSWITIEDPTGRTEVATRRRDGEYRVKGKKYSVSFGRARCYHDYSR